MQIICTYGPESRRPDAEKVCFYDEMESEWDLGSSSQIIIFLKDFNGHEKKIYTGGMVLGKEMQKKLAGVL